MVGDLVGLVSVVEDDDSMREAMGRLLNAAGFGCATFTSAEALLAGISEEGLCVRHQRPEVARDVRLGIADGIARTASFTTVHIDHGT